MWDLDGKYPELRADYCRSVCKTPCDDCPRPRLLPEALEATYAYGVVSTQWNEGFSGRTGLRYDACERALRTERRRIKADAPDSPFLADIPRIMCELRVIERAMLEAYADHREAERQRQELRNQSRARGRGEVM